MSDLIERLVNLYHLRLVPTVKRMCARRRLAYTLLTVGVLWVSATALSLLVFHGAGMLETHGRLGEEYLAFLNDNPKVTASLLPDIPSILASSKAESIATALLGVIVWLLLSVTAVGRVMTSVIESEAYVYGLYMICGAGRKQLRRQLSTEFLLAGTFAVLIGIPAGYGMVAHRVSFHGLALLVILPCFLILIYTCATVLAGSILGRSCMRMLNAADTTEYTVSPRRSRTAGLMGKRNALSSAALAFWRMRKHYGTLALVVGVMTSVIFGSLSILSQTVTAVPPTFSVDFADGVDLDSLSWQYLYPLQQHPAVDRLQYSIRGTAEELGTHVLLNEEAGHMTESVFLGERYATASFRIACGDGDTYDELGGQVTIPREFYGKAPTNTGYDLSAVPVGGAAYVYPQGTTPPLSLQVGDTVRLYLPSEETESMDVRVENETDYVTVRITYVEAINSVYADDGTEICPRITEDYLYLNPLDYEKFHGRPHAKGFVSEEPCVSDLFSSTDGSTCILVVPEGYFTDIRPPSHVTVIAPSETVKVAFHDADRTLPDDTYFVNLTAKGTGVYLGSEIDYLSDFDAVDELRSRTRKALAPYKDSPTTPTVRMQYRVEQIIFTEGNGLPYLLLPRSEETHYSSIDSEICAFRLETVSEKAPALRGVRDEAYLMETDVLFGPSFFGRTCSFGSELLPDFKAAMDAYGVSLQFSEEWFATTLTTIRNAFSFGKATYLLAEPYEPPPPKEYHLGYLQADEYPRLFPGTGNFASIGKTNEQSGLSVADLGAFGLFDGDSIGELKRESLTIPGLYACNNWVLSPVGEVLPGTSLSAGHGIFVTDTAPEDCPIQAGDTLSVALRADTSVLWDDPYMMSLSGSPLLAYLLDKLDYRYMEITVDEVRIGDTPELILSDADMAAIMGRSGAYENLEVYLSPTVSMKDYLRLHADLARQASSAGWMVTMNIHERFITDAQVSREEGLEVLHGVGLLALCAIPLLLLTAQFVFFEKRAEEWTILSSIGYTGRQRRTRMIAETGFLTILLGAVTAAACPLGYLLMLMLADKVGAAISPSAFDPVLYACMLIPIVLSCLLSGILTCLRAGRRRTSKSVPPAA